MFKRILLAYDESEPAQKAYEQSLDMAKCFGAALSIDCGVIVIR
jgi:hypothetical protein